MTISKLFKHAKIPDKLLRRDIAFILMSMILSNIDNETEQDQLLEEIDMDVYLDDMEEIVYSLYGDDLEKVKAKNKEELAEKNKEITRLKTNFAKAIEEINARKDIPSKTKKLLISTVLKS